MLGVGDYGPQVGRGERGLLSEHSAWWGLCEGREGEPPAERVPWCRWDQGAVPAGRIRCPEAQSRGAGLCFARLWLQHGKAGWEKQPGGSGAGGCSEGRVRGGGAPASLPAASPPWPSRLWCLHRTTQRNQTSLSRGWAWKRPGFIRQADVQADSSIPMHTITGFYTGLCPSCPLLRRSRVRSSPRRQRGAWGFSAKGTGLPAPHFHSQIPRALLRKLGESRAGDRNPDSRLHLRKWGISVPERPRASTDPSQRGPEGARISPVSGHRCHRFGKRTLTDGSGEGKGFWLPQRSPIQDMGTRALHGACGC